MITTPIRLHRIDPVSPWLRMAQDLAFDGANGSTRWWPALEVRENEEAFLIDAEIPGVSPEDIELVFEDGVLELKGTRRGMAPADDTRVHLAEFQSGEFQRSIRLPTHIDSQRIEARVEAGLLHVRVPKAETARARRISIAAEGSPAR
jgi:HSP20 family protein